MFLFFHLYSCVYEKKVLFGVEFHLYNYVKKKHLVRSIFTMHRTKKNIKFVVWLAAQFAQKNIKLVGGAIRTKKNIKFVGGAIRTKKI